MYAMQYLLVRGSNKQQRMSGIISNFTKGRLFSSGITTKSSCCVSHSHKQRRTKMMNTFIRTATEFELSTFYFVNEHSTPYLRNSLNCLQPPKNPFFSFQFEQKENILGTHLKEEPTNLF